MCVINAVVCRIAVFSFFVHSYTKITEETKVSKKCALGSKNYIEPHRKFLEWHGPTKGPSYDPHLGFEPYWQGGEWVFAKIQNNTEAPKQEGSLCGNKCPILYKVFGVICGRNKHMKHKQFENYCALINEDCFGREKWTIAYRGDCKEVTLYPTDAKGLITRVLQYEERYKAEQAKTTQLYYYTSYERK